MIQLSLLAFTGPLFFFVCDHQKASQTEPCFRTQKRRVSGGPQADTSNRAKTSLVGLPSRIRRQLLNHSHPNPGHTMRFFFPSINKGTQTPNDFQLKKCQHMGERQTYLFPHFNTYTMTCTQVSICVISVVSISPFEA